jgi:hypothetical protein
MVKCKQECRHLIHRNNPLLNGHSSTNLCTMHSKFSAILLLFRECLELQQINLFDFSITRVSSCYFIKEVNQLLSSPQENRNIYQSTHPLHITSLIGVLYACFDFSQNWK